MASLNLVTLYKALGGGWEFRQGNDFVPETIKAQMRERTDWGVMLSPEGQKDDVNAATSGTEQDRGRWRWRQWEPK